MTRLSACMIVKNEEEMLPRCLESIQGTVDELIVVDTGSTDRTMEIARSFGAKIYEHPWQNDFSLHRNQSIGYATGDWILIIDADERLVLDRTPEELKRFLNQIPKKFDAVAMEIWDYEQERLTMKANTTRFFRNGKVEYKGIIHNQASTKEAIAGMLNFCRIYHYGYGLSPEKMKAKFKRTETMLLDRLAKDPTDYVCHFYLSQIYGKKRMSVKCIQHGEEYLKHRHELRDVFMGHIYVSVVHHYQLLGDSANLERVLLEGLQEFPDDLDLNFALVDYAVAHAQGDLLLRGAMQYHATYQRYTEKPGLKDNRFIFTHSPDCLCHVLYSLAVFQLTGGIIAARRLMDSLSQTPEKFQAGILKELDKKVAQVGVSNITEILNEMDLRQDGQAAVGARH